MNKILTKKQLSDHAYSFVVENGQIARSSRPGNFVTVRADIHSERIPLVVVDSDKQKGTLTLVVQEAGLSSTKFCQLAEGDEILDVVGPLGTPTPSPRSARWSVSAAVWARSACSPWPAP